MGRLIQRLATTVVVGSIVVATGSLGAGYHANNELTKMTDKAIALNNELHSLKAENAKLHDKLTHYSKEGKQLVRREFVCADPITGEIRTESVSIKNYNPLNIKCLPDGQKWRGQVGTDYMGHAIFKSREYGIRAAAYTLRSYETKHGIRTIDALVERFCMSSKEEYKKFISHRLGIGIHEDFSIRRHLPELIKAMARWESGMELEDRLVASLDLVKS